MRKHMSYLFRVAGFFMMITVLSSLGASWWMSLLFCVGLGFVVVPWVEMVFNEKAR